MNFQLIKKLIFIRILKFPMKGTARAKYARLAGINIPRHPEFIYIGDGVVFDSLHPELISIEDHVHITDSCILLTHYLDTSNNEIYWKYGAIHIKKGAFIGARSIITKPCVIGENSIVGAGSVITRDIPDNEIWGGNPACFIKKRQK